MNTTTATTLAIMAIVTTSLLAGCTLLQPRTDTTAVRPADQLLFYSRALLMAAPQGRLAMLETARDAYAHQPTAITTAHLALAYGQPGYDGYAPDKAADYAQQALAAGADYWGAAANAFLRHFAALTSANSKARTASDATQQDMAKLRRALAQAKHKLEALTQIETELSQ